MTRLSALHTAAQPWLNRPATADRGRRVVDPGDRADLVTLDQITADCTALAELDTDLAEHYAAPGLAEDLWLAAYSRDPQLADAREVEPGQRANRAITAAMLGTPEHTELRRSTMGDPYAAAMAVLAQGPALRRMLRQLDEDASRPNARRDAHQAHQAADRAADQVGQTYGAAAGSVDGDPDAEVDRPLAVDVAQAIAAAHDADDAAAGADAELAEQHEHGDMAAALVRAAARDAARAADAELAEETAAMVAWGVGEGERERLDPDARMRLADKLRTGKLAQFAELIGRFRQMSTAQRSRRVEHAKSEYVGVTLGDDLGALVPGELVNLAVPALRAQFASRYAERQLMVYDQRGEDHEAQGAIIACIDCSYSMTLCEKDKYGFIVEGGITGEAYAKALALALLDQAREATPTREFAAILFDESVEPPIRFPADQPVNLDTKLRMAELFPGGGTDFQPALDAAVRLLEAEHNATGKQKADIVFITDGEAELDDTWLATWREKKTRLGFRCFGITVGWWADQALSLDKICDDVRRIEDLSDPHATADLFRAI